MTAPDFTHGPPHAGPGSASAIANAGDPGRRPCVVHVVTSLDFGGVESHMATLGRMDGPAEYRPVFCAISHGGKVATALVEAGSEVTSLRASARIPSASAIWRLYRLFRRARPVVVHTHGAEANFHGLIAAALARVTVRIGEEIGIPDHGALATLVFKLVYRRAHKVIGVSQSVMQWLVASSEVPADKALTLLNPVRLLQGRGDLVPAARPFRACFVGRLEPVKNLVALVTAFGELLQGGADAELWLIGEGSLSQPLEQLVEQLGLRQFVKFHGYQDTPAGLVEQCHVCIQPSLSEGFGLALVEAMGSGVPVISTRVGAAPDIVLDGRNGWLVDGFDDKAIRIALDKAYRTSLPALVEMGQAARATVSTLFDPRDYLMRLEGLYDGIRQGAAVT